jgi:RNA polymerase sigma-70 factor (ECF subfamily)
MRSKRQRVPDRLEFDRLLMPHAAPLFRSATYLVGVDAAEDVTQETMLRAWKYFDTFDPESNSRAWLFRILRNVCNDRWSRPSLELPVADLEEVAFEPYYDWEGKMLADELSWVMQEALRALPDEYRWAILLVDVEEYSYKQISLILNCPIGTVMSRINRGRRMLARLLRPQTAETQKADELPARSHADAARRRIP